ncbi:MAG: hypothetical protein OEZ01_05890, partial [Candidatus Heimdallarchaeota archaeon]|nr:hypothetical protein [Candidatus Heimdallarchaeota archaeon]
DLEKYTDAPINKNTWKSFLKFNKPAMYTIATNKSIEKRSSQLIYSHILISGLTLALIMLLFNENPFTIPILRGFVNVIFVYFATILSYNFFLHKILVFFGNKPAKGIIKNHFSAQISFLIIGLALSVITSIYIRIFDASGLLFGLIIVILILVLTCIIMVVHHILFIKIVTDENFLLILVITYIAGAFAWIFGGYYVQIMLDYIWRLII